MQWQLWYGSVFLVFMWVYHGLSARWVYDILNWEKPLAVVLYLFLPLFTFAGFAVWYVLSASCTAVYFPLCPCP